jgi:cholesterol transport system auxiliary component
MRPVFRTAFATLLLLGLAACATAPGIPDTVYHRLPEPAALPTFTRVFAQPLLVEVFAADGLHSDQALLYGEDGEARLKAYHYQLWVDPPSRLLQRRLIAALQQSGLADLVSDRLPPRSGALRIEGRIAAFERVRGDAGWEASVALGLRAERPGGMPLLQREYRARVAAGDDSLAATTRAFGAALDQVFADFLRELAEAGR